MTLYTAVGKYILKKNDSGELLPHVVINEKEHELDILEMIMWSSLMWNIYTFDELKTEFYRKEREAHVLGDITCEGYVNRLEARGFIAVGHGITGIDALHDLISKLYVVPVNGSIYTKTAAFLHLTFIRHIAFKTTKNIFKRDHLTDGERKIMRLAKKSMLSVGEISHNWNEIRFYNVRRKVLLLPSKQVVYSVTNDAGRKPIEIDDEAFIQQYRLWKSGERQPKYICKRLGISYSTFKRRAK